MRDHHHAIHLPGSRTEVQIVDAVDATVTHKIKVNTHDYWKWVDGEHVQTCFPYLNRSEREVFITGMGQASWDKVMGPEDDS